MTFVRRLEDGRIVKLNDSKFAELVNGAWEEPCSPIYLDEYWNADSVGESELPVSSNSVGSN